MKEVMHSYIVEYLQITFLKSESNQYVKESFPY